MTLPSLDRLGVPGVAGLGLLLFCLSFYLGSIGPGQERFEELNADIARLATRARPGGAPAPEAAPRAVPSLAMTTEALKQLNTIADKHGVQIEQATYTLSSQEGRQRLEITLPLKANYPAVRAYLREILSQPEALTLEELTLHRANAGEGLIEANLRLSSAFSAGPAGAAGTPPPPAPHADIFPATNWAPPPPPVVEAPPPPPPQPEAPPLPFRFLGKIEESGRAPVFFLVQGEKVISVKSGQVIDGTYRVGKVDGQQLHFTYLPLKTPQSLTIGSEP